MQKRDTNIDLSAMEQKNTATCVQDGCCTVPNCTNSSQKGFKLYRFPSDKERNLIWVQNCGRERGWKPTKHTCVCEVHFEESQFESHRADGLRKLKPNAIPTIFSHIPHIRSYSRKPKNNDNAFMSSQCTSVAENKMVDVEEDDNDCSDKNIMAEEPDRTYLVTGDSDATTPEEVFINVSVASKFDNGPKTPYNKRLGRKEGINERTLKTSENRKRQESTSEFDSSSARKVIKLAAKDEEETHTEEGVQGMPNSDEQKQCFVCGKAVDKGLSLFTLTNTTKVHMYQKLDKIVTGELDLVLKEEGILCSRCANLLNYMDRIEVELNMLKKAILTCIRKKSDNPQEQELTDDNAKSRTEFDVEPELEKTHENCLSSDVNKNAAPEEIQCHVCKFKSVYKSVMIFHLRQHLKDVYWCDFCNVPLPADWIEKDSNLDEEILTEQEDNNSNLPDVLVTVVPASSEDTVTSKIVDAVACRNYSNVQNKDKKSECDSRKNTKQIRVLNETGRIVVHQVSMSDNPQEIARFQAKPTELEMLGEPDYGDGSIGRKESYQIVLTQESGEQNELKVNTTPSLLTYSNEKRLRDGERNDSII